MILILFIIIIGIIVFLSILLIKNYYKHKNEIIKNDQHDIHGYINDGGIIDDSLVNIDITKTSQTDLTQSRKIKHVNVENKEYIEYIETNQIKFFIKNSEDFLDERFWINFNWHNLNKVENLFKLIPIKQEKFEIEAVLENINNLKDFIEEKKLVIENDFEKIEELSLLNQENENIVNFEREFLEYIHQYIVSCHYFYKNQLDRDLNNDIENNDIGVIEKNFRNNMLKINYQIYNSYYKLIRQPQVKNFSRFNKIYLPMPSPLEVDRY